MDEMQKEDLGTPAEPKRRPRRSSRKPQFSIPMPEFLTHIGQDVKWYYDIRLWSPLILLLLILALVIPGGKKEAKTAETVPETVPVVLQPAATEPVVQQETIDPEAVALAKLAESVGAGRSENVKIIIMWVAVNRSEDRANGYGLSLEEEIARPNQWQGYDDSIGYADRTYQLAKEVLATKASGGLRPLDSGMLWFVLNDNGSITVRDQFSVKGNQKWIEKTVQ